MLYLNYDFRIDLCNLYRNASVHKMVDIDPQESSGVRYHAWGLN